MIVKVTLVFAFALFAAALSRRAAASTRHAILSAAQLVALALPLLMFVVPPMRVESQAVRRVARISALPPIAAAPVTPLAPANPSRQFDWRLIWLLGATLIAASRVTSYIRALSLVRRADAFHGVRISDEIAQPVAIASHIILPRAAEQWDDERLRAVLLHERAHVARQDWLLALIGDAATAIYWFHPLAWLTARRAMLERERACDEAVLAGGIAPTDYAGAIVDVARALAGRHAIGGLAMAERSHLETRVRSILDPSLRRRGTMAARMLVIAAAVAAAPFLAALTPRGTEPDLLGDAFASPFSERIVVDEIPNVPIAGPDAALIAQMDAAARHPIRHSIDFVPFRARWALTQVRNGELVLPLIDALGDGDWRIRAYAAWALGVAGDRRATPALIDLLDDDIWRVRAMAASALASIGDPIAAHAMQRMLDDDAWQVRTPAVQYFRAVGAGRSLFERMTSDRHLAVRTAAREALK